MIYQFTVSEARSAITCPRVFYFDEQRFRQTRPASKRITRIWSGSSSTITGCSTLFHSTIERFNNRASRSREVLQALERAATIIDAVERTRVLVEELKRFLVGRCLNRQSLNSKAPPQQQAFVRAVDQYMGELADVLGYAVSHGRLPGEMVEEFFGDTRKRVDVTFHVGRQGEPIRVRGVLDYIYFDYRRSAHRILDFKLIPAESIAKDLLQASLYALMHHQQHNTSPSVAVLYLHPERTMAESSWSDVAADRYKVFDLLASMIEWSEYDEAKDRGLKPPGAPAQCSVCPWSRGNQCQKRLGPVTLGSRIQRWSETASQEKVIEPLIVPHIPPELADEIVIDEFEAEGPSGVDNDLTPGKEPGPECDASASSAGERRATTEPGLYLGTTLATGEPVIMPLATLATHVSIVGAAGSGKSWLAKVVVEEAIRHGVPVLAIDPQGDLVQFLRPATLPSTASVADVAAQTAFREKAEVRIWTPGTSHAQRLSLSPLRLPSPASLQSVETPERRQEEWEAMLGVVAGNLVQLANTGGDLDVQQTLLLDILRKLTRGGSEDHRLGLEEIINALADPDALGLGDTDQMISKRERDKLRARLFARLRGPTANLFSGGTPIDLDQFVQPLVPGKTPLNVVYLNAMPDDAQKQYFVAAVAAEVYRWMITSASTNPGKVRLLLFLDEARDFLPAGAAKPPAKAPLLRLFAQGRKFGVGCLICTQSPRSVDYQVFSNASTKLIGRLEAAQDVQRVSQWFSTGSGPPAWLPGRNGADPGTLVGRWPDMSTKLEGAEFRSRRLYSLHEGAWSPDRVEAEWTRRAQG